MRSLSRILPVAVALALALPHAAHAQAASSPAAAAAPRDTVKAALIRKLVDRLKVADLMIGMMENAVPAQRAANPAIPPAFFDRFLAEARAQRGELVEMMVGIYERHFTADEVRQLLAFYDTSIGSKLVTLQPVLAQEGMKAGEAWGQRLGAKVGAELAAEMGRTRP